MRWALAVVALVVAGCSSGGGEATSTTAGGELVLTVHALGGGVTWSGACDVGEVRVTVADGAGVTLAVTSVSPVGDEAPVDTLGDCTTGPVSVPVPPAAVYRVTVAGAGPLGAAWSASGEFSPAEVAGGLVATARSPLPSELTAA